MKNTMDYLKTKCPRCGRMTFKSMFFDKPVCADERDDGTLSCAEELLGQTFEEIREAQRNHVPSPMELSLSRFD